MSTVREAAYDEVHDAQQHFRSLLDSLARPGTIRTLRPVRLDPPSGLNYSSVLVAMALLDGDVGFYAVHDANGESDYLAANTRSAPVSLDKAAFIFAHGEDSPEILESVYCGSLTYPDTAATLVLQVEDASAEPLAGALRIQFDGPGVDGSIALFIRGLNPDLLLALAARNAEFPMGIDTILTFADGSGNPSIVGVPRTARLAWEHL